MVCFCTLLLKKRNLTTLIYKLLYKFDIQVVASPEPCYKTKTAVSQNFNTKTCSQTAELHIFLVIMVLNKISLKKTWTRAEVIFEKQMDVSQVLLLSKLTSAKLVLLPADVKDLRFTYLILLKSKLHISQSSPNGTVMAILVSRTSILAFQFMSYANVLMSPEQCCKANMAESQFSFWLLFLGCYFNGVCHMRLFAIFSETIAVANFV